MQPPRFSQNCVVSMFIPFPPQGKARHRSRVIMPRIDLTKCVDRVMALARSGSKDGVLKAIHDTIRQIRPFSSAYACPKQAAHVLDVQKVMRSAWKGDPLDLPLHIDIVFRMPIPASWPKKKKVLAAEDRILHTSKPDGDNALKLIKDCANKLLYNDDAQIVSATYCKQYSESPGYLLTLYTLEPYEHAKGD